MLTGCISSCTTNFNGLAIAQDIHEDLDSTPLWVCLKCMRHISTGHGSDAGISRKANGVDEEKLLQAAAEALHRRVGSSKGMVWCMDIIQKSFMWQYVGPGRRIRDVQSYPL